MSIIKFPDFPAVPSASLSDILCVDQGGISSKETLQQVLTLFLTEIPAPPTGETLSVVSDTNVTLTAGGNYLIALLNSASITVGWTGLLSLDRGGSNASLTASNGGIVWSNATQMQILSGTATANQLLLSGSSASPTWSTSTYPMTNAINTLLYASSANTMTALPTNNNSVLVTSAGGVPSLSITLPSGLSTNNFTLGNSIFSSLKIGLDGDYIADSAGQPVISILSGGASSVNYIGFQNNTTGNSPKITATGSDTNIDLTLNSKGTGGIVIKGTGTNNSAAAGYVGEFISSSIPMVSAVPFTSTVYGDVTSITLTPGDWDIWGNILFLGTALQVAEAFFNTVSATPLVDVSKLNYQAPMNGSAAIGLDAPYTRMLISSTTTVYLTGYIVGTAPLTACGGIYARRAR